MIDNDHARLRRYVTAWTARLARDAEHLQSVRARLQGATVLAADEVPAGLVTLHSVIRVRELDSGRASGRKLRGVERTAAAAEGKAQYRVAKERAAVQEAR
jgi:hypothetical protein